MKKKFRKLGKDQLSKILQRISTLLGKEDREFRLEEVVCFGNQQSEAADIPYYSYLIYLPVRFALVVLNGSSPVAAHH